MNLPGTRAESVMPGIHAKAQDGADPEALLAGATALVADDMARVNRTIQQRLDSDIVLIRTLGEYIIRSGGKRLRPLILLLSAGASGYRGDHHVILAAVIEFIHTATLLHDDVVDASATRRGQPTANDVWGNEASVLVGDFLYSRAFEMMVETDRMAVMKILAATTNAIAEGEVLQLLNAHEPDTTEEAYFDTINRKTARLFEAASRLGGVVGDQPDSVCDALGRYGLHLGNAFQLVDDVMDYITSRDAMGKDAGDDLAEGKPTLPLIHAMRSGNPGQAALVRDAIREGDRERMAEILQVVTDTGAIDYTLERAREQSSLAIAALDALQPSPSRSALEDLARFSVLRGR